MSDPGSDPWIASRTCSNIWISGTPMRCSFNMFFIFPTLLKGTKSALNSFCSKLPESPFVYKIAFWEIMKPKFPLIKLLHQTNVLIYPNYPKLSQIIPNYQNISTDSFFDPTIPPHFLLNPTMPRCLLFVQAKLFQRSTCLTRQSISHYPSRTMLCTGISGAS